MPFDLGLFTPEQRELWDKYFGELEHWTDGAICPVSIHELWEFEQIWMLEGGGDYPRYPPELEAELREHSNMLATYMRNVRLGS